MCEHNHGDKNGMHVEECPRCHEQQIWDAGWEAGYQAAMRSNNAYATGFAMAEWEHALRRD